jgi:multiple sugar transport system ATP-binding protein
VEVLHGIDLIADEGEFVALVGPSGCGKSTLLRVIAGLEDASGGDVLIGGRSVDDLAPRDRDIAMVFQNYALYPHMTVAENMSFSLRLARLPKAEIDRKVDEAAAMLSLTELLKRRPSELSGGQRQRVAMGRAVVRNPAVFLFDEPLSNLDAKLRVQMRAEIKLLHARIGKTSIYVTHDQVEAMTLADKLVVLNAGRIEQIGAPMDLYTRPANRFVASFIGSPSMNFLDGGADAGGAVVIAGGVRLQLPTEMRLAAGRRVVIGLRPEHLVFRGAENAIPGRVLVFEPMGAQAQVSVETGAGPLTAIVEGRVKLAAGDTVSFAISPEDICVFDQTTGERL